jgi:hypothetical protein
LEKRLIPPLKRKAMATGTTERSCVVSLGFMRKVIRALPPSTAPKSGV